ncbi:MAG: c-type cytochrome biogenesis protein CcsB [Microbacteriaceae bacterium]
MFDNLISISNLLVYSAIVIYVLAFVSFTVDLGQRAGANAALDKTYTPKIWSRLGVSMTILAATLQLGALITRGASAGGRVPWANMFEFTLTSTFLIAVVFLLILLKFDLRFLGAFILGLITFLLLVTTLNYYVDPIPLQPALQSWWLVIHVVVAALATAFFAVSFGLSSLQLVQQRFAKQPPKNALVANFARTIPGALKLENNAYQINIIGFVLWTFTLVFGSIWADFAWGRYWGWDTKEVWTLIIWIVYAAYIHARATRGWRGTPSAWLSIIGFLTVLFNYYIVNIFFNGLHAYSGL